MRHERHGPAVASACELGLRLSSLFARGWADDLYSGLSLSSRDRDDVVTLLRDNRFFGGSVSSRFPILGPMGQSRLVQGVHVLHGPEELSPQLPPRAEASAWMSAAGAVPQGADDGCVGVAGVDRSSGTRRIRLQDDTELLKALFDCLYKSGVVIRTSSYT